MFCASDEVEDMDEESDAIQDWLDSHKRKSDREAMVTNRLGVSRGIKFELEKSWESKCYFGNGFPIYVN